MLVLSLHLGAGCSPIRDPGEVSDAAVSDAQGPPRDAAIPDLGAADLDGADDLRAPADLAIPDLGAWPDLAVPADLGVWPDLVALPDLTVPRDLTASPDLVVPPDLGMWPDLAVPIDLAVPPDLAMPPDLAVRPDLATPPDFAVRPDLATAPDLATGPISGGPCLSGGSGATALRVRWTDGGGRATVNYEVHGLPDKTRWKVGAYGYSIGYVPQFVDPFLGSGGLQLDSGSFIDIEISTVGVHRINNISLALLGRSYSTGASGSFNWMTFTGGGSTPINYVSNVAPYRWYPADATADISAGDGGVLIRVKAGGGSGSLVVNRLELCMDAN